MIWRNSLPARVALATTGLLSLLLLLVMGGAYATTALLLRQGMDRTLTAAIPAAVGPDELEERAGRFEKEDDDHRQLQVLSAEGAVRFGSRPLPVDQEAVAKAKREGVAFLSVVEHDHRWERRTGPDWWQALTPEEDELRVIYALVGEKKEPIIVQMAAPLGLVGEVLPVLLKALLALAAVGALLSGLIAWRMAAQTYRPLRAIIATADEINAQTPSLRIPDLWPDRTLRRLVGVLNAMIGRLHEAFEAQGRFVGAAAHELRGPLAAMRAELEVALRRERSAAEYREALDGALLETTRLSTLSEHLLTLARYERGAGLAMVRGTDLTAILHQAATEVSRSTGGEARVEAPPELLLDGDPVALERLVANLVRNGIQAAGAPVVVAAEGADDGVWIHVRDHGRGIDPADLPHLFEPFYRADPARGRDGGAGLGLAIVKTAVEAHGGRVEVESTPGAGSTFHVWLPRRQG